MIQEQNSPREDKHQLCGSVCVRVCLDVSSAVWVSVQLHVSEWLSEVCVCEC